MTLLSELRARKHEIHAAARRHGVKDVRVFGSVARGEEGPASDIDLLINVTEDCDAFGFLDFQEEMQDMFGRRVDIVFERGVFPFLYQRIKNDLEPL